MSCSGYFDTLLDQANQESFKNQVLQEIHLQKEGLQRKLRSCAIQGNFHKVNKIRVQIDWLKRTENIIKRILEA